MTAHVGAPKQGRSPEEGPPEPQVLVLQGSPKGPLSVTDQYVEFLVQRFPHVTFERCPIGTMPPTEWWPRLKPALAEASLVLWATPVYAALVPAQLKEFIEMVEADGHAPAFAGKNAALLFTSARFFDHTAYQYLRAICEDWQMDFLGGHSAEMLDLLEPKEQARFSEFFCCILERLAGRASLTPQAPTRGADPEPYRPGPPGQPITTGKKVTLVIDGGAGSGNLGAMAGRLAEALGAEMVDLGALSFQGCCGNVFACGRDHSCPLDDDFVEIYRQKVMTADILIFAGQIRDRFLSLPWKRFMDRALVQGHVPSLAGKQVAWLISGPLRQLPHLREVLASQAELQMAHLVDIVTDEEGDSDLLDVRLDRLARELIRAAEQGYVPSPSFLGVAGMNVLERIVRRNSSVFRADLPFFRERRGYALPAMGRAKAGQNALLRGLFRLPGVDRWVEDRFPRWLVLPFQRAVKRAAQEE